MKDSTVGSTDWLSPFVVWSMSIFLFLLLLSVLLITVIVSKFNQLKYKVELMNDSLTTMPSFYSNQMESQQRIYSDSLTSQQKLIDKMIAVLATKDPMAFQAVQAMNMSALQTDPVQEDYERSYDDITGQRYGNLDDPAVAAELSGLL